MTHAGTMGASGAAPRRAPRSGAIEDGGRIVGAWRAAAGDGVIPTVTMAIRTHDGRAEGWSRAWLETWGSDVDVTDLVTDAVSVGPDRVGFRRVPFGWAVDKLHVAMRSTRRIVPTFLSDAVEDRSESLPIPGVKAFLSTLDQTALAALVARYLHHGALDLWEGVDATFVSGAPLASAMRDFPHLSVTLCGSWRADAKAFAVDVAHADPLAAAGRHLHRLGWPRWLVRRLGEACACWEGSAAIRRVRAREGEDALVAALRPLSLLPADRRPRTPDAWAAYLEAVTDAPSTVRTALDAVGAADLDRTLGVKGDGWEAWTTSFRVAAGGDADVLRRAVSDLKDHRAAFARQVVRPALSLAAPGEPADQSVVDALAWDLLCRGRTLRAWIAASTSWHARRAALDAVLAALPGVVEAVEWLPCLPDHVDGPYDVTVLLSSAELAAEGRDMGHCVGGYVDDCLRRGRRILSIGRTDADGVRHGLSTVEVEPREGSFAVRQHRGRGNAEPVAAAANLLKLYSRRLEREPSLVRMEQIRVEAEPDLSPGYDARVPGNWEAARDAWAPWLSRCHRRMTPDALSRMARRLAEDRAVAGDDASALPPADTLA